MQELSDPSLFSRQPASADYLCNQTGRRPEKGPEARKRADSAAVTVAEGTGKQLLMQPLVGEGKTSAERALHPIDTAKQGITSRRFGRLSQGDCCDCSEQAARARAAVGRIRLPPRHTAQCSAAWQAAGAGAAANIAGFAPAKSRVVTWGRRAPRGGHVEVRGIRGTASCRQHRG